MAAVANNFAWSTTRRCATGTPAGFLKRWPAMKEKKKRPGVSKAEVLRDEAELRGLYPPKRTELTGKGGGPLQYEHVPTDDERVAGITALLDRARARRDGPAADGAAPAVATGRAEPPPAGGLSEPG